MCIRDSGTLAVGCGNDAIWQRLREALDIPDRLDWRTNAGRLDDRDAVDKAVERALSALTVSEADELLASHGVPSGTVQGIREVAEHPAVQLVAPTHPVLGPIPMAAPAYRSVTARRDHSPPPTRDQHRAEILDLLGLGNEASRLEQGGAFGQPR